MTPARIRIESNGLASGTRVFDVESGVEIPVTEIRLLPVSVETGRLMAELTVYVDGGVRLHDVGVASEPLLGEGAG